MKGGQVSVFVIIAIVLVATGILTFYTVKSSSKDILSQPEIKAKVNLILSSINNCEEISADSSVMRISWQGGYRNPPKNYLDLGWTFIPYYFFQEQTYFPEKSTIEKELAETFDDNFYSCVQTIDYQGLTFTSKKSKTITEISPRIVKFTIDFPFSIATPNKKFVYDLKKETIIREYKLYEMYEVAKYITNSHKEDPQLLCINCLVQMAEEKGLLVDFINLDETKLVAISLDTNNTIDSERYIFQFLEQYKRGELTNASTISTQTT